MRDLTVFCLSAVFALIWQPVFCSPVAKSVSSNGSPQADELTADVTRLLKATAHHVTRVPHRARLWWLLRFSQQLQINVESEEFI